MIGSKFSRHFFNHSEVKPKPMLTRACKFFPRFVSATCKYSEFWLVYWIVFVLLIGQSNYFGFGFTTFDWNSLYTLNTDSDISKRICFGHWFILFIVHSWVFFENAESIVGSKSPGSNFFPCQSMGFRESNFYNSATKGRGFQNSTSLLTFLLIRHALTEIKNVFVSFQVSSNLGEFNFQLGNEGDKQEMTSFHASE